MSQVQMMKREVDTKRNDELRQVAAILDAQKPLLSVVGDDSVKTGSSRSVPADADK